MARAGLVERIADPDDRRVTLVTLTPLGAERYAHARVDHRAAVAERFLDRLDPADLVHDRADDGGRPRRIPWGQAPVGAWPRWSGVKHWHQAPVFQPAGAARRRVTTATRTSTAGTATASGTTPPLFSVRRSATWTCSGGPTAMRPEPSAGTAVT
jgi:hypothetical protein